LITVPQSSDPMAPLIDPLQLRQYRNALEQHRFTGYVRWKRVAEAALDKSGLLLSARAVSELMWQFVRDGGTIDRQTERRPEFDSEWHYDLRITIKGVRWYIETVMHVEDDDVTISVVSFHEA